MNKVLAIARHTFVGTFRNKIFWVLVLFGLMLLGASILLGLLGQEQEIRMLIDLGLAAIETLTFLASIFLMVNLVLEEAQSKSIYLVLTRSVAKGQYILGKFLGALAALAACMAIMTAAHAALLLAKGWRFQDGFLYALSVLTSFEKIALISAWTLFFSLISSSGMVAMTFAFFIWVLGHFALELKFLSAQVQGAQKALFKGVYLLIPHFQYMNARDLWSAFAERLTFLVPMGFAYTAAYTALLLLLSWIALRRKEF